MMLAFRKARVKNRTDYVVLYDMQGAEKVREVLGKMKSTS